MPWTGLTITLALYGALYVAYEWKSTGLLVTPFKNLDVSFISPKYI